MGDMHVCIDSGADFFVHTTFIGYDGFYPQEIIRKDEKDIFFPTKMVIGGHKNSIVFRPFDFKDGIDELPDKFEVELGEFIPESKKEQFVNFIEKEREESRKMWEEITSENDEYLEKLKEMKRD